MKMILSLTCFLTPLAVVTNIAFANGEDPKQSVIRAILARQESLQNIIVKYETNETYSPPIEFRKAKVTPDGEAAETKIRARTKPRFLVMEFRLCDGKAWFEKRIKNAPVKGKGAVEDRVEAILEPGEHTYLIEAYSGSRYEQAWKSVSESWDRGSIRKSESLPHGSVIDRALGFRAFSNPQWMTPKDWSSMTIEESDDGLVRLSNKPANAQVQMLRKDVWTFDPQKGYALTRYQVLWKGKIDKDIVCNDFRPVGQLQLPHNIVWKQFYNKVGSDPVNTMSAYLSVQKYQLGELDATKEDFLITWPTGSVVLDERNRRQFVIQGKPHKLTDEIIQTRYKKKESQ